jgi:polysaccharide export outer membrane protein
MRRVARTGLMIALVLVGWGCRSAKTPAQVPDGGGASSPRSLGPGDVLEIRVRDHEDISGKYQIADDGTVRFPWIGAVDANNRTGQQVAQDIERRLADGWLRQPQVAVLVAERQNREVSVLGQVNEPGSFPFKERLTLVQAISLAGGMNPLALPRKVKLIRQTENGPKRFEIDVTAIIDNRREDIPLQPGDIVFIPESPI